MKLYVMDIASRHVTSIISANILSNASINSDGKNVRYKIDYYILHTVLSVIISLLIIKCFSL